MLNRVSHEQVIIFERQVIIFERKGRKKIKPDIMSGIGRSIPRLGRRGGFLTTRGLIVTISRQTEIVIPFFKFFVCFVT
jgi:acetylglutamate synthase